MAKFHVGEIAILNVQLYQIEPLFGRDPTPSFGPGTECSILEINPPFGVLDRFDYRIGLPAGENGFVMEPQLRKRPQPGLPESVIRLFNVPVEA